MKQVRVFNSLQTLSRSCASFLSDRIEKACHDGKTFDIILTGGNTPIDCYNELASILSDGRFPLKNINWFFGDERWVPADHEDSNERMVRKYLLGKLKIPEENIFSWKACTKEPYKCAFDYNRIIHEHFIDRNKVPDILLLGMGEDGHTASLFPQSRVLLEAGEFETVSKDLPVFAASVYVPGLNTWRLSLTPRILNRAQQIIFLISGEKKRESFKKVMNGTSDIPAAWIQAKHCIYFVTTDIWSNGASPHSRNR
ncbi:MAG: 6-phosphogluconolactonase [Spirochaetales bacterium]|nr:6-phosphogluconolactonase [Spirochaetales bacterium]